MLLLLLLSKLLLKRFQALLPRLVLFVCRINLLIQPIYLLLKFRVFLKIRAVCQS